MVKQKQTSSTMVKQKQRTGNITETTWDSGLTYWDTPGIRTIWDKDINSGAGWVKEKQI